MGDRGVVIKRTTVASHKKHDPVYAQKWGDASAFTMGPCMVLVSRDAGRAHLSISCSDRYPTWDEVADAREALTPMDVPMAMVLPPAGAEYCNEFPYCLHIWELHDPFPEWTP